MSELGTRRFYTAQPAAMPEFMLCLFFVCIPLFAAVAQEASSPRDDVPALYARAAVLADAATGTVLYAKNPEEQIPPASLTKLMTTHVVLRESASGNIPLDRTAKLPPESWARNQPPRSSVMGLDSGQIVSLKELLLGLAVPSGNDAAVALALNFSPDIEAFALEMNKEAAMMGMRKTVFTEPSGISENNLTTALDFARFCAAYMRLHPEALREYHSVREFTYPRQENIPPGQSKYPAPVTFYHHISLLNRYKGADGLKTGYIDEAGYNLAVTAAREGTRFIAVILGVPAKLGAYWGAKRRDADGEALLDWGFRHYRTLKVRYPELKPLRVWQGRENYVDIIPQNRILADIAGFTVEKHRGKRVFYEITLTENLRAPLPRNTRAGTITFSDESGELGHVSLLTARPVEEGGFPKKILDSIIMFFTGIRKGQAA